MGMRGARGLALGVLLQVLISTLARAQMQKLMGGTIGWTVNPRFLEGAAQRTVTFNMRTTWALGSQTQAPGCSAVEKGKPVACAIPSLTGLGTGQCNPDATLGDGCSVAERFGVLCVAQLVRAAGGKMYAKYSDNNAQCVTETNVHLSSRWDGSSYNPEPAARPIVRTAANALIKVGIPNKFTVRQIYSEDARSGTGKYKLPSSTGRKPSDSIVVTGTLTHTVQIDEDVSEVVAWLAPRAGFANYRAATGLLLTPCSTAGTGVPCMFNECSLQRIPATVNGVTEYQGAAFRKTSTNQFAGNDVFWESWGGDTRDVQGCGSGKECLRKASPALESFVALCSNDQSSLRRCSSGINNYYSPVTSLPDLIEVAITGAARLEQGQSAWRYRGYNPFNPAQAMLFDAPHQGFRVQSYDYDGHQMTQYTPQMFSELKSGGEKMGAGDIDVVNNRNPANQNCQVGDKCCTRPNPVRSMRVDCVESDAAPPVSNAGTPGFWPAVKLSSGGATAVDATTGCRYIFDFDRDARRAAGNIIKPDFSYRILSTSTDPGLFTGVNRFTQHVMNTIDFPFVDMDNPVSVSNHINNAKLSVTEGQGIVQNVFSMFGCDAGRSNQPPVFVRSLCYGGASIDSCTDSRSLEAQTVFECPFWLPCTVDLYARDFTMIEGVDGRTRSPPQATQHRVDIQYAIGYDHLPTADLEPAAGPNTQATCCAGQGHFKYFFRPSDVMDTSLGFMRPTSIGQIFVRCFVAYDVFREGQDENPNEMSCPSMPHCIKIKITGSKPTFVAPTPLGTSFDDNGVLVPLRHDFPACQGFKMTLQLKVTDSLPDSVRAALMGSENGKQYLRDLKYRIYVEDKDVGFDKDLSLKMSYTYLLPGGEGNLDFFSADAVTTSPEVRQKCGTFSGYGAERQGNNAKQESPNPLVGESRAKSVMSAYRSDAKGLENCRCTKDPCSLCTNDDLAQPVEASVTVGFESDPTISRGVSLRETCRKIDLENGLEYELANCREKLTNMDQVICAVAYDNARDVYKRWVGETDPNGDDIRNWLRTHSNGDQASEMHCFRILIAAPPVFVTDPSGAITPMTDEWASISDTTGNSAAYKRINFRVGQFRELTFLAQDPNPSDAVEIFILADPGIPKGMSVGLSECIVRTNENSMCKADDQIDRAAYPNQDWSATFGSASSRCSRAKRKVSWTPAGDAAGQTFKVCAVARDNSNECYGKVSEFATQRGWFGEQQCVIMEVLKLLVTWGGDFVNLGLNEWTMKAYVGCEFKFHLKVLDALAHPNDALDAPYPLMTMVQDTGLQGVTSKSSGSASRPVLDTTWVPGRGTEGQSFYMCFAANDMAGILSEPTTLVCRGGTKHLTGCHTDDDCGGGVCQRACVKLEVQRCEYCIKGTDTLTWMTRYFGIETNWLRLWALNSYQLPSNRTQNIQGAIFPAAEPAWILSDGSSNKAYITDPDVIMDTGGVHRIFVGTVYHAAGDDKLLALAARFRTTVKTLMAMNPDVEGDEQLVFGNQSLCVLPCTAPVK